ncbi:OLC1v1025299C1 [Oldenlandia corymbosa var. corymbosa]|uniref:OLC1v1025299C1 n=1 Tax=Oldenlandia corymbosa var. corymbosa TaxID=529605 RepID=A0AAV1C531_OLDCO|nr:OLC1v1025299C1 [Oldenlandia corymbosa var. corymbosa]
MDEASRRVRVQFVTKLKPPYKAPPTSITIPSNLTCLGLSTIVSSFLKAEVLAQTLEIEYIKAMVPRTVEEPSLHDDWVNAIDGSSSKYASSLLEFCMLFIEILCYNILSLGLLFFEVRGYMADHMGCNVITATQHTLSAAQNLGKQIGVVAYIECSSKAQQNVKAVFDTAIKVVFQPPWRKEVARKRRHRTFSCFIV